MPSRPGIPAGRDARAAADAAVQLSDDEAFSALVASVTEYAVFLVDDRGRILSWNRGAEQAKLFPREEAIGLPIERLYLPEDVAAGVPAAVLRRAAEHGSDLTQGWRLRRDGSRIWASVVTTALYDRDGRVRGYLKIVRDETARHREEDEHEAALQRIRMLTDACPVGLLLLEGPAGHCMWANRRAAELLGVPPGELQMDPSGQDLHYPDGRPVPQEERPLFRILRGETVAESEEFLLRRPDGSTLPVLGSAAPVLDEKGQITGAVMAFDDITAAKRVEQRWKEWTAVVAHELRQPLGAIVTSVGLLMGPSGDEQRLRRAGHAIIRNARRLDRMIQDLLDVSRIESGHLDVHTRGTDLEGHVRAAADRIAARAPDRHVLVQMHGTLPAMCADPDRLDQILDNLLSNALRYGDPGTDVTIDVDRAPDGVAVAVTNRGPGIAAEQMTHLFQPFGRDACAARLQESIGLGLYITKGLVEAQGGHIEASSTPGAETTFRFVLPAGA